MRASAPDGQAPPAGPPDTAPVALDAPRKKGLGRPRWLDSVLLVVGLGLLGYVVSRFPLGDVLGACRRLGPLVALTPVIALGWMACNTSALYYLLDGRVPWLRLLQIRLTGDGYNALLPLAGFGGEPYKIKHLGRYTPIEHVLTALIRDRVLENGVGFLFTGAWLAAALAYLALPGPLRYGMALYVAVAAGLGLASLVVMITSLPSRAGAALARSVGVATGDDVVLPAARFAWVVGWYTAGRAIGLLEGTVLLWLLDLGPTPLVVGFCYSLLGAAGFLSFLIPGGFGIFEGTTVYLFDVLGFAGPLGVAFALARRGRMMLVGLVGVALHLVGAVVERRRAGSRSARPPETPRRAL